MILILFGFPCARSRLRVNAQWIGEIANEAEERKIIYRRSTEPRRDAEFQCRKKSRMSI